eukprot:scaffold52681_cov37-Tisochrysis_lutea.AAC.3
MRKRQVPRHLHRSRRTTGRFVLGGMLAALTQLMRHGRQQSALRAIQRREEHAKHPRRNRA